MDNKKIVIKANDNEFINLAHSIISLIVNKSDVEINIKDVVFILKRECDKNIGEKL